jgi:RNA polymerase sigma-70 factor (TIGR02943 family)
MYNGFERGRMERISMASNPTPDVPLLERLRGRDPETLAATVQEHARPMYRMARGMGFSDSQAEDLVQDVFTVFLQKIDEFEGRSQLRTWLFGILHWKMRERRRALQRDHLCDSIDPSFVEWFDAKGHWIGQPQDLEQLLASKEIRVAVDECLAAIPVQQREVFLLREIEGMESKEICNNLQISITHMGVLIHRARHRLRKCLEAKGWR